MRRRAIWAGLMALMAALMVPAIGIAESDSADAGEPMGDALDAQRASVAAQQLATDLSVGLQRQYSADDKRLLLMLTGNISGDFARVNCRQPTGYRELYWARHAAYYHALRRLAEGTELIEPVALNAGNSLFPGALGRYLVTRSERGSKRLAEIIDEIPVEVHGVGDREFAAPRRALVDFLEQMKSHDVAMQAANLHCDSFESAEAVCGAIDSAHDDEPYRVIERGGIRIAVTTVLDPQLFGALSRYQHQDTEIAEPEEMLPDLIEQMRRKADLVVVQHQVPSSVASQRAYDLASSVEGIDLLVASHLIDSPAEAGEFDPERPTAGGRMPIIEAATTGTPIVSSNSAEYGVINVELDVVADRIGESTPNWSIRRAIPRRIQLEDGPYHPPTEGVLEATVGEFCDDWGDPIGEHAELAEEFELEQLQKFILNVMRFATRSEVALSNRGAFRHQEQFPLTDELTKADIYTTLPFENRLVTVDMKGVVLNGLVDRLGDDLIGAGIVVRGGDVRVNGRAVSPDRVYRIAINDFLAEGGDGVFAAGDFSSARYHHPAWSEDPPSIGDIVIDYVESGAHLRGGAQQQGVSAEDNFPDLHDKFLWSFNGSLNASYNQVSVRNPDEGYDESQLTVQSTDQINLEGRLTADADSRYHGWNNRLDVQYATTRVNEDGVGDFEKTRDRIRLRSRYRYKRLRAMQQGHWYIPDPFVEGQAESEFQRPEERDWHRLNLRAISGASWQLLDPLEFQLGLNVSQDVLEPGGEATWGINAAYTLARVSPVDLFERPIRFESEVEYFYNDIGRSNIHEARSTNRLYFAIFEQLFFTTTFNAFLYRDDTVGQLGANTELTVGLNYEWEQAVQNF